MPFSLHVFGLYVFHFNLLIYFIPWMNWFYILLASYR